VVAQYCGVHGCCGDRAGSGSPKRCGAMLRAGYRVALAGGAPNHSRRPRPPSMAGLIGGATDCGLAGFGTRLFAAVESAWGRLDVLFNNAGSVARRCGR